MLFLWLREIGLKFNVFLPTLSAIQSFLKMLAYLKKIINSNLSFNLQNIIITLIILSLRFKNQLNLIMK